MAGGHLWLRELDTEERGGEKNRGIRDEVSEIDHERILDGNADK